MSISGGDFHILRLGYWDRANLLPLLYPLKAGWVATESPWKLELVNATPAALLDDLLADKLDAAFVAPVGLVQNGSALAPVGAWGLASEGITATVLLLAPQRLDMADGSDLAVTPPAAGSTPEYLLRTLLKPYYDITLNLRHEGDAEYNLKGARLMYGDDAARQAAKMPNAEWVAEDLGVAWYVQSGLPMVWEMLAAPRDLEQRKPGATEALQNALRKSQRSAQEQQASILEEAVGRLGLKRDEVKQLFARQRYTLGPQEQKGLGMFLDMATRAGMVSNT
jgi:predicted solute-binding protein